MDTGFIITLKIKPFNNFDQRFGF